MIGGATIVRPRSVRPWIGIASAVCTMSPPTAVANASIDGFGA